MSSMTRAQLNARAFATFGEAAGYITVDNVNTWLQDAYAIFTDIAQCLIVYREMNVVNGLVYLPKGIKTILFVDTAGNSYSARYELGTNIIEIRPYTQAPGKVNVKYIALPSFDSSAEFQQLTNDNDRTALSETNDLALVQYALGQMHKRDQRYNEAAVAEQNFYAKANEEMINSAPLRRSPTLVSDAWTGAAMTRGSMGLGSVLVW